MAEVNLQARTTGRSSATATLSIRTDLSVHYILGAAYFAKASGRLEKNKKRKITEQLFTEHRAWVTGAIFSAVASLEATINELYIDATEKNNQTFQGLNAIVMESLAEFWEMVERKSILEKYQFALIITKNQQFKRGELIYQDADSLIKLRNALIHYKPEWDTNQKKHKEIEDRLKSKFEISPFADANAAFFPIKCLSHGATQWAVKVSIDFIEDFFRRMRMPLRFDPWRSRLKTT